MKRKLYDLAGEDEAIRYSPYCWRVKLALAHKGLEFETVPWHAGDKEKLAFSGQALVPVLVDGERIVTDSWKIAHYLDERYADRPSLALTPETLFLKHWTESLLQPQVMRLIIFDIIALLRPEDRDNFRTTREARFGMPLEKFAASPEKNLADLQTLLKPLKLTLEAQPFFGGETPAFSDFILFGVFQWARCASKRELVAEKDKLHAWRERMLDLYGGLARRARTV